jgi:acyl-coenzyme A thioesterase 9
MHMDDIWFRKPVEVGSFLYFNSQICYVEGNYVQNRVSAEVPT